jgi:hypothetical protein
LTHEEATWEGFLTPLRGTGISNALTITFDAPVTGFGFDTVGVFGGNSVVEVTHSGGVFSDTYSGAVFRGYIDIAPTITSVRIYSTGFWELDDFTYFTGPSQMTGNE